MTSESKLFAKCEKCSGTGEYAPPPVQTGGMSWMHQSPGDCPNCQGVGAIPTADGREILQLMKRFTRHGRIEIPE